MFTLKVKITIYQGTNISIIFVVICLNSKLLIFSSKRAILVTLTRITNHSYPFSQSTLEPYQIKVFDIILCEISNPNSNG
jgi:hypothetical protein